MKKSSIKKLINFYIQIEKLKTVLRHSYTSNKHRQESSAEHSWMMSLIAITLFKHFKKKIDELKVLKMITVHDLAEIITLDIPAFEISERQERKQELERKALNTLTNNLPDDVSRELKNLWEEFEERKSLEAQLAQAIDKIEVVIQHNIADSTTWDQGDIDIHPYYQTDYFDFDSFMRELRDSVEIMSYEKIKASGFIERLKPEHRKTYKKLNRRKK